MSPEGRRYKNGYEGEYHGEEKYQRGYGSANGGVGYAAGGECDDCH
jgi:hypothetical protein